MAPPKLFNFELSNLFALLLTINIFPTSAVLTAHLDECVSRAKQITFADIVSTAQRQRLQEERRRDCLERRSWDLSHKVRQRMRKHGQESLSHVDPSFLALQAVPHVPFNAEKSRNRSSFLNHPRSRHGGILMPRAFEVPHYDSWIPVLVNYWVGKDLHVEPYMPFLGDHDTECEAAFEVYEDMAGDAGKDMEISDGELNDAGKFVLPRGEPERVEYHTMAATRWREATRKAILFVLDSVGNPDDAMWLVLAQSLGMGNIRRVKAVAEIARQRREEERERIRRRERDIKIRNEIKLMRSTPVTETIPTDEEGFSVSRAALEHYCLVCHVFSCQQHAGFNIEPILPIEDLTTTKREKLLEAKKALPCSSSCGLKKDGMPSKVADNWVPEEILLLRDAVTVFGMDPCAISVVVGSRTCAEVFEKLNEPMEAEIAQHEIQKARIPRRLGTKFKSREKENKQDNSKMTNKTVIEYGESVGTDRDFVPCEHAGPCTAEVCTCVQKGLYCESTCGCNFGRYCATGRTGGVVWTPPSNEALRSGRARECFNRFPGCGCKAGTCTEGDCPCYDAHRACSPDFCECDVTLLPSRTSIQKRRCRNGPVTVGRHKRTFIGKSEIHGFGLFAAERFDPGDLVGIYSGQLIDTRLADMIGRIYDATNRTYIFNVTETLVIDGGLLGSKAKFVNHTRPGSRENCHSKLVRVRGDAFVVLFCKRPVLPGEEFLFDYRFTGEVPAWAKEDKSSKSRK